ncbi:MAG: TIGR00730 family Rossman fold protein [Clostridia bacterium]|nr:TIGR00730 family Rossman fold protein [Clostridia bacterium]
MKICIFGAASAHIDTVYIKAVEELSEKLAKRGHTLVFGAGGTGLMGAAARGFKRGGGFVHGVIPEFFREEKVELIYEDCDKITYTETMAERKFIMEDEADAFIITPGGIGTFEEFFEVLTLKQLGRHNKAMVIYNIEDYYDDLEKFMDAVRERKFITFKCSEMYSTFKTAEEIIGYIENYTPTETPWRKLKIGD